MELDTILEHIKRERKNIIYVGIGTYAGLKEPDGTLLLKNYHQYPPFLQNLKNSYADVSLSILLIDPCQENPPYLVEDKGLVPKDKGLVPKDKGLVPKDKGLVPKDKGLVPKDKGLVPKDKGLVPKDKGLVPKDKDKDNDHNMSDIYTSPDQSLTLYTLRQNVYTDPYRKYNDDYINITEHLRALNNYAIANNVLFIYHDFTGRSNRLLAEFFDAEIKQHLDHIIYGLGLREDMGCYFDLTDLCAYHPVYRTAQGALKLFNVYDYIVNEKLQLMFESKDQFDTDIVNNHLQRLLLIIKQELNNVALQALRIVFRLITGEDVKEFDHYAMEYNYFPLDKRNICLNYCREKNFCDLYDFLLTEFGKKLEVVAYIKKLDMTGREILEFITMGDDPFKWYDNVKHFV